MVTFLVGSALNAERYKKQFAHIVHTSNAGSHFLISAININTATGILMYLAGPCLKDISDSNKNNNDNYKTATNKQQQDAGF